MLPTGNWCGVPCFVAQASKPSDGCHWGSASNWVGFPAALGLHRALLQPWEAAWLQTHPSGRVRSHGEPRVVVAACPDSYLLEEIREWVHKTWVRNRHVPRDGQRSRHPAALLGCSGGSLRVLRGVCLSVCQSGKLLQPWAGTRFVPVLNEGEALRDLEASSTTSLSSGWRWTPPSPADARNPVPQPHPLCGYLLLRAKAKTLGGNVWSPGSLQSPGHPAAPGSGG